MKIYLAALACVGATALARFESGLRIAKSPWLRPGTKTYMSSLLAISRKKKVGGRTIQIVGQVMRSAFEAAIKHERFFRANPWRSVPVPRHVSREPRIIDINEARRFIAAAQSDKYEALWVVMLTAGLRFGEALALEWRDVDLKAGHVTIRQQTVDVAGVPSIGRLKTKNSKRVIDVGRTALAALRRRRKAAEEEGHGSLYIFTTRTGGHLSRSNLRSRNFAAICTAAGIEGLTPHHLRHAMASHGVAAGVSPITVAARLGHANAKLVMDRYGHLLPGQQREAARVLEGHFGEKKPLGRKSGRKRPEVEPLSRRCA